MDTQSNLSKIHQKKFSSNRLKKNGYAIRFIKNPSEVVQLTAVKQDGYALQFITNPSEVVQLEAVKQDVCAIQFIENPSEAVLESYLFNDGDVSLLKEEWFNGKSTKLRLLYEIKKGI